MSESTTRIYLTGMCEGFEKLRDALAQQPGIEVVGFSDAAGAATGALAGRASRLRPARDAARRRFPADEIATIREHTRAPIILVASGEAAALLEDALEADVADVLLLPQLTENVVFAIRKATHAPRRAAADGARATAGSSPCSRRRAARARPSSRRTSPPRSRRTEGRRTLLLDLDLQFGDAAIMLGLEPEKTIYDLVVAPGELDSREARRLHDEAQSRARRPRRAASAGGRRARHGGKVGRLIEVARACYDAIVVDTSPFFHGPMLATLDRTDELLVLLRPRRADAEERPARAADARAALVPAAAGFASS